MVQLCFVLTHHWHFSFRSQTWRNLLMLLSAGLIIVKCLVVISANCSKLLCAASRLLWPHYPNPFSLSLPGLAVLENHLTWLTFPPRLATTRLPLFEELSGNLVHTFTSGWVVTILVMPSLAQIFHLLLSMVSITASCMMHDLKMNILCYVLTKSKRKKKVGFWSFRAKQYCRILPNNGQLGDLF